MHTQLVDHLTPIATAHTIEQLTEEPHFPSLAEMIDVKKQKRLMTEGTELFNRHSPQKGVEFLCEKGLLKNPLEPQVAGGAGRIREKRIMGAGRVMPRRNTAFIRKIWL